MNDEDAESGGQICADCSVKSPPTETNYTLISSRYGWRLTLETSPDGRRIPIWRCPKCWQEYRKRQPDSGAPKRPSKGPK